MAGPLIMVCKASFDVKSNLMDIFLTEIPIQPRSKSHFDKKEEVGYNKLLIEIFR